MAEYKLRISEAEDDSRRQTLEEILAFIAEMYGRPMAVVTLDGKQSEDWDREGDVDYQDAYGRQIVGEVTDGVTETLVIRNVQGLPVALGMQGGDGAWTGIGVEKRLRLEIAGILQIDDEDLD